VLTELKQKITILELAEERHLQSVMIRIVECEAERRKQQAPEAFTLISNVLNALRHYLQANPDQNLQREKAVNEILKVLYKEMRAPTWDDDSLIRACKDKLQPILIDIVEDHKKQFKLPGWTPGAGGLFALGNLLHPSKLASAVQAALDKTPIPPILKQ